MIPINNFDKLSDDDKEFIEFISEYLTVTIADDGTYIIEDEDFESIKPFLKTE